MTELATIGFVEGMMKGRTMDHPPVGKRLDFEAAYRICLEHPESTIFAGLAEDWAYTSGEIWEGGKPVRTYLYGASSWATPVVVVDGEVIDCYTWSASGEPVPDARMWTEFCAQKAVEASPVNAGLLEGGPDA